MITIATTTSSGPLFVAACPEQFPAEVHFARGATPVSLVFDIQNCAVFTLGSGDPAASCTTTYYASLDACPAVYTTTATFNNKDGSVVLSRTSTTLSPGHFGADLPTFAPGGSPSVTPSAPKTDETVTLTFQTSKCPTTVLGDCKVTWGDGSEEYVPCPDGSPTQVTHVYGTATVAAPYNVIVRVYIQGDSDAADVASTPVTVIGTGTPVLDPSSFRITPLLLPVGGSVSAAATATDPGSDLKELVINWGDGTNTSYPCTASPKSTCSLPATASHVYSVTGVFAPTATPADAAGTPASPVPLPAGFVVVYDPQGGFVVGGAWITSPPGALASDTAQTLTGMANFGFNSKYKAGASAPTGNTEFVFSAGGFRFRSTSYDWMVISGSRVQFKGSGIVNSQPSPVYKFSIMAEDGGSTPGSDRFRLRVFSLAADGTTEIKVYDNFVGGAASACASLSDPSCDFRAATTALGGGSIVIQKSPSGRRMV
ncbi:hypothetical protein HYH03_001272 [Edaphochlamys debaryana]|uniref:PKD domain-containing protein n=1 Tax=Edaphochlamys debaryana TaxID=47281 RepID=A0A835YCM0_9CHLO|nr:hypothetical protein HYH03_001272 [Edaphochlamys debaryana]|eukprot:KAG2500492.1 hypothetical protein HYH03_001272 [Edaphochlamys debaryana]